MANVIIMLAGGDHQWAYFPDRAAANDFVEAWANRHTERIKNGTVGAVETSILTAPDPHNVGRLGCAVLTQYVIGLYVQTDALSPAERMAAAMEKCQYDGDEWKGE